MLLPQPLRTGAFVAVPLPPFQELVDAVHVDSGLIQCRAPAVATARSVPVEVTSNDQDFTSQAMQYVYEDPLSVISVEPSVGPATGNTAVVVTGGTPFPNNTATLKCRWADYEVPALWLGEYSLSCMAPPARPITEVQTVTPMAVAAVQEVHFGNRNMFADADLATFGGSFRVGLGGLWGSAGHAITDLLTRLAQR